MTENEIGTIVVGSAIAVHRELGPGLLEAVYEVILARELQDRKLVIDRQVPVAIHYKGIRFDEGFRADMVVEGKVIVEVKSVERIDDIHRAQLLNYLRISGIRVGLLINFAKTKLEYERFIV